MTRLQNFIARTHDYIRRVEDQEIEIKQVTDNETPGVQTHCLKLNVETLILPTISVILSIAYAELDVTGWTKSESGNLTIFYK